MIIDKIVKINVTGGNITHLKSVGYNIKHGDIIEIPLEHLSINSHKRINISCDICGNKRNVTYQDYMLKIKYDGKYYCCDCMINKRKKILMETQGVENVFQLKSIIEKADKTRLEKYGNSKYRNDNKIKKTNLIKYGCENVFQNEEIKEKIKEVNLEKYGNEYLMKTEEFKEKSRQTNLKKHGVEYPQQNMDIFYKSKMTSFKISEMVGLKYQGGYEKDFLIYCLDNKILNDISKPRKSIKYIQNNRNCYYHPDFYVEKLNLIIEIKSKYWWNIHLEKNLIKEKTTKEQGYNYIVIMDKNYLEFKSFIDKLNF